VPSWRNTAAVWTTRLNPRLVHEPGRLPPGSGSDAYHLGARRARCRRFMAPRYAMPTGLPRRLPISRRLLSPHLPRGSTPLSCHHGTVRFW
jgi:hypothetical protein